MRSIREVLGGIRLRLVLALALGAGLVIPAQSQAIVTIGSNLAGPPTFELSCVGTCTFGQAALPAGVPASGGVTSPVNGTVVRWRIRTRVGAQDPLAFRVIRPAAGGVFQGAGTSATVTPPANAVTPFGTAIPIRIGDLIGINCCTAAAGTSFYFRAGGAGAARLWNPPLFDGGAALAPFSSNEPYELSINADIQPTSAFKLGKPKSSNGQIKIKATLPNPGKLVAGDKGDKKIGDASAAARKLERTKKTVSAPGKVTIKVEPTNVTESQLAGGGAKKVKIKVAFTPLGGEAAVETVKATLRG